MAAVGLVALGVCMSCRIACLVALLTSVLLILSSAASAQVAHSEQVQVAPPLIRAIDPPAPDATAAALEDQADRLRGDKLYMDALDYYRAALNKKEHAARLLNKIGITELMMQRYKEARKSFERAIVTDHKYADAYNNLGVILQQPGSCLFFQARFRTRRSRLSACLGTRSRRLRTHVARRSAGATAKSGRSCSLRLHRRQTICQDGVLRSISRIPAQGDGRWLQRSEKRVQG
jgi:hypothetical protein